MAAFITLLVLGAFALVFVIPLWAMSRAHEARDQARAAQDKMKALEAKMQALEALIRKLRADLNAAKAAAPKASEPLAAPEIPAATPVPPPPVVEAIPFAPPPEHGHRTAPPEQHAHHRKERKPRKHPGDAAAAADAARAAHPEPVPEPIIEAQPVAVAAIVARPPPIAPKAIPRPPPIAKLPPPLPARGSDAEAKAAVAAYSAWREVFQPLLLENLPWFIGGFLVIGGSLYFISEAWGAFKDNEVGRHLLVVAALLAYAAGFVGVGLWLKSKKPLATASRAMAYVGLSLVPVALVSLADLYSASRAGWAITLPIAVAAAYPVLYLAAGLLDRSLARPLATALSALLALVGLVPLVHALSPQATFALPYVAWAIVHAASGAPLRGSAPPATATIAFHLSALAYAMAFVVGLAQFLAGRDPAAISLPAAYGPLAALLSLTAVRVDVELRARWKGSPQIDAAVVAAFAATLAGIAASYREPALFALSSALGAALFAVALRWYRRPLLLVFGLGCAALSTAALLFLVPPLAILWDALGQLAERRGLLAAAAPAWAFLLLPLAEAASRLAGRYRARGEDRLATAADRTRFGMLASIAAFSFSGASVTMAGPTLLLGAGLLCSWHRRDPRERTAWSGALALGAGAFLLALAHVTFLDTAMMVAAVALAAAAVPGLRDPGSGARRPGSSALLACALVAAMAAPVLRSGASWLLPDLFVLAAVAALAAVAFESALPGAVFAVAISALGARALLGEDFAAGLAQSPSRLWLVLPAAQCALVAGLRALSGKLPHREGWRIGGFAVPARARGLHALSEPLLAIGWLTTIGFAARAFGAPPATAAALLLGVSAIFVALALFSRVLAGAWLAAAAFVSAGAFAGPLLLSTSKDSMALGATAAALGAFAVAAAIDRYRRAQALRTLGTALLLAARAAALVAVVAGSLERRDLAAAAAVWALSAVLVSSAASGLVAALLASALFFQRPQDPLVQDGDAQRALWLLAGQIVLVVAFRFLARKIRGARPRPIGSLAFPRARSFHALSEPLQLAAWLTCAFIAWQALIKTDDRGAALFTGAGLAALSLGALARRKDLPGAAAAISFTTAGALFAITHLGNLRFDVAARAAVLGAVLTSAAVAALSPLGRSWRRLQRVVAASRLVAFGALALSAVAGLALLKPLTDQLFGLTGPTQLMGIEHLGLALLVAAFALPALRRDKEPSPSALALLSLAGACVAGVFAAGQPAYAVGTALAALAVALVWGEYLLRGRQGLAGRIASALFWGAPLIAGLALAASFLPPGEPFAAPLRQAAGLAGLHWGHIPADLLLVGFLLSCLAARGGPVFINLLFAEAIILASRVRISLLIPTRGHGMILAGGALLGLAVALRKWKPRYALSTLLWCAAALYGGWARMLFGGAWGPLPPDTQQWAWALAGGLLAVPPARFLWSKFTSVAAAAAIAASLAAGASQLWPLWFARGWPMAVSAIALTFAALALLLDRLDDARAFFCARAEQATALRGTAAVMAALSGGFAALWAAGSALRLSAPLPLEAGVPLAFTLALAAGAAFLVARSARPEYSKPMLVGGAALAVSAVASPLLAPLFGAASPVVVLITLAVLAHALTLVPALRDDMLPGSLALWGAALLSTRARTGEWTTAAALAAGALLLRSVALPEALQQLPSRTALLVGAAVCALSWAAGFSPLAEQVGVVAGAGLAALVAAFAHELTAGKLGPAARTRSTVLALAGAALLAGAVFSWPFEARSWLVAGGALLCAALLALRAMGRPGVSPERYALDLSLAALAALYFFARWRLGLGDGVADLNRNAVLGAALALVGIERALVKRRHDLSRSLFRGSALLPLLLVPAALDGRLGPTAAGGALLYGLLAWLHRSRLSGYAALALVNVFFFATWRERGVVDTQLYTIPLGASLLLAAQLSRRDLPRPALQSLRAFGCLVLYAGTAWQMVGSDQLMLPLILCGMALATVALGVFLQVRAFAYLGTATLVVTVLANLLRFSVRSRLMLAVSLTMTGLSVLGGMAYVSVRREQALELYRRLVRGMEDWD